MKKFFFILLLFSFFPLLKADVLVLKDGRIFEGKLFKIIKDDIYFATKDEKKVIKTEEVESIYFGITISEYENKIKPGEKKAISDRSQEESVFECETVLVEITDVSVGKLIDKEGNTIGDKTYLLVKSKITNKNDRKQITYRESLLCSFISIQDDVGNSIRGYDFYLPENIDGMLKEYSRINPNITVDHCCAYKIPLPKTLSIKLDINLSSFDGEGKFTYVIGVDKILGFADFYRNQ